MTEVLCPSCGGYLDTGYHCTKCGRQYQSPYLYSDNRTLLPDKIVIKEAPMPEKEKI